MFERSGANYLRDELDELDDRIGMRPKDGRDDRGDIGGVRTIRGERVVLECKNHQSMSLGSWLAEAERERGNDDDRIGIVVHKRRSVSAAGEQFVTMTLADLVLLLDGNA
ncbi:hypothetical protein [Curtobacterium sp. MWU13-2055]|uniref:hypothetical protein n=1 Tax=Curtobacterium sp. MWU13-2055 TaxID=2931928 RepID=UPI00200BBC7E|nr:hypothetical protein [Curtobacterium sp. MWU13-2055]